MSSSILSHGLIKLPEHFLSKGDQNGITDLKLQRSLVCAKGINSLYKSDLLEIIIGLIEDGQMKIGGRARREYGEALKNYQDKPIINGGKNG